MKNLKYIIGFALFMSTQFLGAQTPPQPPTPPSTSSSSSSSSVSISKSNSRTNKTSVSVTNNEEGYKLKAKYGKDKFQELYTLLKNELGEKALKESNGEFTWNKQSGGEKVYEIVLDKTKLTIESFKQVASPELYNKIKQLGADAKSVIGGGMHNEADHMRREADRLKREADRLQREADRMKRRANEQSRRMERQAENLQRTSRRLVEESMHNGGVSSSINMLLGQSNTLYNPKLNKQSNQWVWPAVQNQLLNKLESLGYSDTQSTLRFTRDFAGIFVNGEQLDANAEASIAKLFDEYGIIETKDFQFYKKGAHIVVVSGDPDIKGFFRALSKKGILDKETSKLSLQINGNTIVKDNQSIDEAELSMLNALMQEHNIIPAPGKILESMGGGKYKLGYSLGDNAHLGTWIF